MHARSRLEQGFSLGELLATIAVAGVLTAAAVPTFQSVISESRRAAVVNQLVSTMHMARSEAITQNARVVICPGTDGEACTADAWAGGWFSFVDRNDNGVRDEGEPLIATGNGDSRMQITTDSFGDALVYRPSGRVLMADPGATQGEFTICDSRGVTAPRVVIVPVQGHPRLSENHADGSAAACAAG